MKVIRRSAEEEKRDFEELDDKRRKNGWGLNIGFSSDWYDFMRRTNSFLSNSRQPPTSDNTEFTLLAIRPSVRPESDVFRRSIAVSEEAYSADAPRLSGCATLTSSSPAGSILGILKPLDVVKHKNVRRNHLKHERMGDNEIRDFNGALVLEN